MPPRVQYFYNLLVVGVGVASHLMLVESCGLSPCVLVTSFCLARYGKMQSHLDFVQT